MVALELPRRRSQHHGGHLEGQLDGVTANVSALSSAPLLYPKCNKNKLSRLDRCEGEKLSVPQTCSSQSSAQTGLTVTLFSRDGRRNRQKWLSCRKVNSGKIEMFVDCLSEVGCGVRGEISADEDRFLGQ